MRLRAQTQLTGKPPRAHGSERRRPVASPIRPAAALWSLRPGRFPGGRPRPRRTAMYVETTPREPRSSLPIEVSGGPSLKALMTDYERRLILDALNAMGWRIGVDDDAVRARLRKDDVVGERPVGRDG